MMNWHPASFPEGGKQLCYICQFYFYISISNIGHKDFCRPSVCHAQGIPLDSETRWTRELWSNTKLLKWQNEKNIFFCGKKAKMQQFPFSDLYQNIFFLSVFLKSEILPSQSLTNHPTTLLDILGLVELKQKFSYLVKLYFIIKYIKKSSLFVMTR